MKRKSAAELHRRQLAIDAIICVLSAIFLFAVIGAVGTLAY